MLGIMDYGARHTCYECGGIAFGHFHWGKDKEKALENLKKDFILPSDYHFERTA